MCVDCCVSVELHVSCLYSDNPESDVASVWKWNSVASIGREVVCTQLTGRAHGAVVRPPRMQGIVAAKQAITFYVGLESGAIPSPLLLLCAALHGCETVCVGLVVHVVIVCVTNTLPTTCMPMTVAHAMRS